MTDTTDTPTAADAGVIALAHELTELRMALGLDPDGSGTLDRLLGKLATYDRISDTLAANGAAYDPSHAPARAALARRLRHCAPLLTRIAKPDKGEG